MRTQTPLTEAARQYEAAYAAHYSERDLSLAFRLYKELLASHPGEPEAGFSRMQLQNIVNTIVPKQDRLDAQLQLASARLGRPDAAPAPIALVS
ncbi:MAG: hypothetical protein KY475_02035 [Planctomycetes bacterium]|nr:hypothetical protein [Planctomycetota bacterium]